MATPGLKGKYRGFLTRSAAINRSKNCGRQLEDQPLRGGRDVPATPLAVTLIDALAGCTGLGPREVDDETLTQPYGGPGHQTGRRARRWIPVEQPARATADVGSGLNAVVMATMQVETRVPDLVLATQNPRLPVDPGGGSAKSAS